MHFYFYRILLNQDKPFNFRYDFIFDRCRAIRQEIVIQNFSCQNTVQLLEPIAMFLNFSLYRLGGSPIAIFDQKICSQHLQECLLRCLSCYEELERLNQPNAFENRTVIEAIYLMFNIEDANALQRAVRLNQKLKSSFVLRIAIKTTLNFHRRAFFKVFRDIQSLPHLVGATASLKLSQLRKEVLRVFSIAYNSSTLSVPADFIKSILIYDDIKILLKDLENLGIQSVNREEPIKVNFNRTKFDNNKSIVSTGYRFVNHD